MKPLSEQFQSNEEIEKDFEIEDSPQQIMESRVIAALIDYFKRSTIGYYENELPYVEFHAKNSEESREVKFLLESIGIVPWGEEEIITIDNTYDLKKLVLFEIIEFSREEVLEKRVEDKEPADLNNVVGLDPYPFPIRYKSIPDLFKKGKRNISRGEDFDYDPENGDLVSDTEMLQHGLYIDDLNGFAGGENKNNNSKARSFLRRLSEKEYYRKGKKLFSAKDNKEILLDERREVLIKAGQGDLLAREKAIKMNVGLVDFVVLNFSQRYSGVNEDDLMQVGMMGLMRAIDKWDHELGFMFSTYAVQCIEGYCHGFYRDTIVDVRMPRHTYEYKNKILKAETDIEKDGVDESTQEKISNKLGISTYRLRKLRSRYQMDGEYVSIDDVAKDMGTIDEDSGEDNSKQIDHKFHSSENDDPLYKLILNERKERIVDVLDTLTPREAKVIRLRFGLDTTLDQSKTSSDEDYTLERIASMFDVTRERIRQIEGKALRKLRHPFRTNLIGFDYKEEVGMSPKVFLSKLKHGYHKLENIKERFKYISFLEEYIIDRIINPRIDRIINNRKLDRSLYPDVKSYEIALADLRNNITSQQEAYYKDALDFVKDEFKKCREELEDKNIK